MIKDWIYKDGWPSYDPTADKNCLHCCGIGILFHSGVFSFEVECVCIPNRSEKSKEYTRQIGIESL